MKELGYERVNWIINEDNPKNIVAKVPTNKGQVMEEGTY